MNIQKRSTKEILESNLSRTPPAGIKHLKILLHNVRSMHNVGAAFRSADAFGISEILLSGFSPVPPRPEITKTAIGAEKHVSWTYLDEPKKFLNKMKQEGYIIAGLEQTNQSKLLPDYNPPKTSPLCLVFGNEVTGIDKKLLPHIDLFLEIPQFGQKHSLNVSVAVGVVLYAFLDKYWSG